MKTIEIKTDFIFCLGEACRTAFHLNKNRLKLFPFPLDTMTSYNLEAAWSLFENKFDGFFTNRQYPDYQAAPDAHTVHDLDTGMRSFHHFPLQYEPDEYFPMFRKKMKFRYVASMFYAKHFAKTILFISQRNEGIEQYQAFLQKMAGLLPNKKMVYLNILHDTQKESVTDTTINDSMRIIEYTFFDKALPDVPQSEEWRGNIDKWKQILNEIKINHRKIQKSYFRLLYLVFYPKVKNIKKDY